MNWKYFYLLPLLALIFFFASLGYGQTNGETQTNPANAKVFWVPESFISVLSIVVAILTGLVAIVIIITAWMTFVQLRRFDREFAVIKEDAEKQMETLRISVKDYRPPDVILEEAKEKATKLCDSLDEQLRNYIQDLEENLKERLMQLETSVKVAESLRVELQTKLHSIESNIKEKPSKSEILHEVNTTYKIPGDLMEILLGKVGLAFGCIQKLSEEERKGIRGVLSTNPVRIDDKK